MKINYKSFALGFAMFGSVLGVATTASAATAVKTQEPGQMQVTDVNQYDKVRDNYKSFELRSAVSNNVDGTKTVSWADAKISDKPFSDIVHVTKRASNGTQYGWYQVSKKGVFKASKYWLYGQALTTPGNLIQALLAKNTTSNTTIDHPALTSDIAFSITKSIPVYNVKGMDLKMLTTPAEYKGYTIQATDVVKTNNGMILYPIGGNKYINSSDVNAFHTTLL